MAGGTPITIRFSTSLPDLELTAFLPAVKGTKNKTTIASLKSYIRKSRPEVKDRQLRLIHGGKVLADTQFVSSLRSWEDPKGKGKEGDTRIYVHCVPGNVLPASALVEVEEELPVTTPAVSPTQTRTPLEGEDGNQGTTSQQQQVAGQLRGFDRLAAAGLSQTDIAALRANFTALHAAQHTPDTAPTVAEMRALEEAWMDAGPGTAEEEGAGGEYEDLLIGAVLGFFWPLGAIVWLLREEGVWSARRRTAVVASLCINIAFSLVRVYH